MLFDNKYGELAPETQAKNDCAPDVMIQSTILKRSRLSDVLRIARDLFHRIARIDDQFGMVRDHLPVVRAVVGGDQHAIV